MRKVKTEIKWAIIFALMMLLWMWMEKLAGLHDTYIEQHQIFTNLVAIPAILLYYFAIRDKRRNYYNGVMSYGKALTSGLILTLFVTILSPITQVITSYIITPDYFDNMISYTVALEIYTQEAAEAYFNIRNYLIVTLYFTPIMGVVTTLIVGLFNIRRKSKKREFHFEKFDDIN